MTWNKAQLLADVASSHIAIGTPEMVQDSAGCKRYIVSCVERGKSQENLKPTGYPVNITFLVYHEGLWDEEAMYERNEPMNSSNTDVSSTTFDFAAINKVYGSFFIRQRVRGWLLKKIIAILSDANATAQHLAMARDAIKDVDKYVNSFMAYEAQSEDIISGGNSVNDSALSWIGYNVVFDKICVAFGFNA
jgi:hypothetical protein